MSDIGTAYVKIEPSAKGISGSISSVLEPEADSAGKSAGGKISGAIGGALKAVAGATAAGATAVAGVVKSAVTAFADFEQLEGGVETLFGDNAKAVMADADEAFKTAGLSANEYMETVTSFAASLNASLGENVGQSANYANTAVTDMADNANKMGSSMESIQNAYQGFAKQNFTMLDNLKLGYGGTKSEMERLMRDAEQLGGYMEGSMSVDNFADVIEAIHIVQENLGITGTTAAEAGSTISGSLAMTKSAWENVLTAIGTGDDNKLATAIDQMVQSAATFGENIMPVIAEALSGVSQLITQLAPEIAAALPDLITQVLPGLLDAGVDIIQALGEGILAAIPELMPAITETVLKLGEMLIEMLPQLVEVGLQVIAQLALGIGQALPDLVPTIVETVLTIVDTLIENIDMLIDAAIAIIVGLAEGLVEALPELIERLPEIIVAIVEGLVENAPKLLEAAVQIIVALATGLIESLPELIAHLPEIIVAIVNGIINLASDMVEAGKALVDGLWEGIKKNWDNLAKSVTDLGSKLVDKVKGFFKIGSPSKLFRDEIGQWIPEGVAVGIEANADSVNEAVDDMVKGAMVDPDFEMMTKTADAMTPSIASGVILPGNNADVVQMLSEYLPMLLTAVENSGVELSADAHGIFNLVRNENNRYRKANGVGALA